MVVADVQVAPGSVSLPDLNQSVWNGASVVVKDPAANDNALSQGLAPVLARQVVVGFGDAGVPIDRSSDFAECVRQEDERLCRRSSQRGPVWLI